jgi:hypothetical protein
MDRQIKADLEEYLRGTMASGPREDFERRLDASGGETRKTVELFLSHSAMIREAYRVSDDDLAPPAGFYGRVMARVQQQRSASIWFAFLEPAFSRRLAFASLALLLLLSVTMITTAPEQGQVAAVEAEPSYHAPSYHAMDAFARQDDDPAWGVNRERDRNTILVNLTTYQEF